VADPTSGIPPSFRPRFAAGRTLSRGLSALLQRPLLYLGFTLTQIVPVLLSFGLLFAVLGADGWERVSATGSYPGWFWPVYILACAATLVPCGAALHAASEQLVGRTVSYRDALIVGTRRFLPLLGVSLMFGLAVVGGTFVLFIPSILVCVIYIVAMPIAVQERRGVRGALRHAASLSKGYRITLLVIGLGYLGITIAGYAGALLALVVVGAVTGAAGIGGGTLADVLLVLVLASFGAAVVTVFPVLLAATYVGLREEKEGGTADQLAGVFA
jgi:hypothetical protein